MALQLPREREGNQSWPAQKRRRGPCTESRRVRLRMSSPQSPEPSTSSTPTTAEIELVERYSGLGITGDRKIPVSEAVSRECRVP